VRSSPLRRTRPMLRRSRPITVGSAVRLDDFVSEFEIFPFRVRASIDRFTFIPHRVGARTTASLPFQSHGQEALVCSLDPVSGGSDTTASMTSPPRFPSRDSRYRKGSRD